MLKASFRFVFLLLVASHVLSESIEEVSGAGSSAVGTRKVRQIPAPGKLNNFLQTLNPQFVPATRLGIVGGMRQANFAQPAVGTILRAPRQGLAPLVATVGMSRATALPIVGSPFIASTPLGAGAQAGLGQLSSAVGTVGRNRVPAVFPTAGASLAATRRLGSLPPTAGLRSTVGTLGRTRNALPLGPQAAAVVQPNLIADGIMNPLNGGAGPSIVPLPFQRSVSPLFSVPGILRAGRSVAESDEEVSENCQSSKQSLSSVD